MDMSSTPSWSTDLEDFIGLPLHHHDLPTSVAPAYPHAHDLYSDLDTTVPNPLDFSFDLTDPLLMDMEDGELAPDVEAEEGDDLDMAMENLQDLQDGEQPVPEEEPETVTRVRLVEKRQARPQLLPDGWKRMWHESGLPVYYHAVSGVCVLARPYEVECERAVRYRKIPVGAVPCLEYQRAREEDAKNADAQVPGNEHVVTEVVSGTDYLKTALLTNEEVREYCAKRYTFATTQIPTLRAQQASRKVAALAKHLHTDTEAHPVIKGAQYVTVHCPDHPEGKVTINIANKTQLQLLHEFTRRARNCFPEYVFREVMSTGECHEVTVMLQGKAAGFGTGVSKKAAKHKAAEMVLQQLAPELFRLAQGTQSKTMQMRMEEEVELFKSVPITDTRIGRMAHEAGATSPFLALTRALTHHRMKNAQAGNAQPVQTCRQVSPTENEYTMTAAQYVSAIRHTHPIDAKMLNAQKILSCMHPQFQYYGEFLQHYGASFVKEHEDRQQQRHTSIIELDIPRADGQPNWDVLNRLKEEMRKVLPNVAGVTAVRYD